MAVRRRQHCLQAVGAMEDRLGSGERHLCCSRQKSKEKKLKSLYWLLYNLRTFLVCLSVKCHLEPVHNTLRQCTEQMS